jgi:hypothetical protein
VPPEELEHAYWRYARGVTSELGGVTLQPLWASFCRAVEYYANPKNEDDFRRIVAAHFDHCDRKGQYVVPADLIEPLTKATEEES